MALLISFIALPSVLALNMTELLNGIDPYDYVKLVSNTDTCFIDCETTYNICGANGRDITVGQTFFEFKDSENGALKSKPSALNSYKVYMGENKTIEKYCTNLTITTATYNINGTPFDISNYSRKEYDCSYSTEVFDPIDTDAIILAGECRNVKIVGKKSPMASIDNVMTVPIGLDLFTLDKYAWWNSSYSKVIEVNVTDNNMGFPRPANFTHEVKLNKTFVDFFDFKPNGTDIAVTNGTNGICGDGDTSTIELPHYVYYWNTTDGNSYVYIKTLNLNDSHICIYYNGTARDEGDIGSTFLFGDNFKDTSGINTSKWSDCVSTTVTINGTMRLSTAGRTEGCYVNNTNFPNMGYNNHSTKFRYMNLGGSQAGYLMAFYGLSGQAQDPQSNAEWLAFKGLGSVAVCRFTHNNADWINCGGNLGLALSTWQNFTLNFFGNEHAFLMNLSDKVLNGSRTVSNLGSNFKITIDNAVAPIDLDDIAIRYYFANMPSYQFGGVQNFTGGPVAGAPFTVGTSIYNTTYQETVTATFTLNVTLDRNQINDTNTSLTYNGSTLTLANSSYFSKTNIGGNFTFIANATVPLIDIQNAAINFTWNITIYNSTGIQNTTNTSNLFHNVTFGYYPSAIEKNPIQVAEGDVTNITTNISKVDANANVTVTLQYAGTNYSTINYSDSFIAVIQTVFGSTANVNITPYLNITWDGQNKIRAGNRTDNQSVILITTASITPQASRIIESEDAMVTVNVTNSTSNITVQIEYDGVNYTTNQTGNLPSYTKTIQTNLINGSSLNRTANISAWLTIQNGPTIVTRKGNTTNNQTMFMMQMTNCAATSNSTQASLNYSFRDENTNALVSVDSASVYQVYKTTSTKSRNWSFSFTNQNNFSLCIYPPSGNFTASETMLSYSTSGYSPRENHFLGLLTNQSQNFTLFMLPTSNATTITVTLQDDSNNKLTNYVIDVYRWNIGSNTFNTVDSGITNFDGKVQFRLNTNGVYYKFSVRQQGNSTYIQETLPPFIIISTEFTITVILNKISFIQNIIELNGLTSSFSYDTPSMNLSFTWNDNNLIASQVCEEVYIKNLSAQNSSGSITIFQSCSTSSSGTTKFTIPNISGYFNAIGYATLKNDSLNYPIASWSKDLRQLKQLLGIEGAFLALLIIGTAMTLFSFNINASMVAGILAIVLVQMLGLWSIGWGNSIAIITAMIIVLILVSNRE